MKGMPTIDQAWCDQIWAEVKVLPVDYLQNEK
jgi:hypothetical protein